MHFRIEMHNIFMCFFGLNFTVYFEPNSPVYHMGIQATIGEVLELNNLHF